MTIEPSITVGNIFTIVSMLIGIITWGSSLNWQLKTICKDIDLIRKEHQDIETQLKEVRDLIVVSRIASIKIDNLEATMKELAARIIRLETRNSLGRLTSSAD